MERFGTILTLDIGVRAGYWTNNAELNGLGTWFDPTMYDSTAGAFLDPGQTRLNGGRRPRTGAARPAPNRPPFAAPANVAWDISGDGSSVLRGGYGMFVNRPQGNVDYANALSVPPDVQQRRRRCLH